MIMYKHASLFLFLITYMIMYVIRNKKRDACLYTDKDAHRT